MDTRQVKHKLGSAHERGFTFVEVLLALIVLASAASVLVGMQSAAISRTIRDRNAQQAMLFARRVMSAIEVMDESSPIPPADEQPAAQLMQTFGIPEPTTDPEKRALDPLRASLIVEEFALPFENFDQSPLQKLTLRVAWGNAIDDAFVITYLKPVKKQ
jgi:prepilin-type N-terminal cleavage/methylation domain-containing protein